MKRRNFVKISGMGLIGYQLNPIQKALNFVNPALASFFIEYVLGAGVAAVVDWGFKKGLDWLFNDDEEDNCCSKIIAYMESEGYYPYKDGYKANFFYTPPPKPAPPTMPDSVSEYGVFTFAKKSPKKSEENTRTVFLAKAHKSKEIAASIPETVMIACILVAKKLVERGYDYAQIQQILLPVSNVTTSTIEQVYTATIYKTVHGHFTLAGDNSIIERDKNNIPIRINGNLVITPHNEKKKRQDDYFSEERKIDLSEDSLEFLYDSIKSGIR